LVERQLGERAFVFAEYAGEFPLVGGDSYLFNSGGGCRITNTQQPDCHIRFDLNHNAPTYIFGVGYSFQIDGLF
jgi:hypothetical protein